MRCIYSSNSIFLQGFVSVYTEVDEIYKLYYYRNEAYRNLKQNIFKENAVF